MLFTATKYTFVKWKSRGGNGSFTLLAMWKCSVGRFYKFALWVYETDFVVNLDVSENVWRSMQLNEKANWTQEWRQEEKAQTNQHKKTYVDNRMEPPYTKRTNDME